MNVITLKMMAPETSIGPNALDKEISINIQSKYSSASVVKMAPVMRSTLAHFL
ncbi:MAG: hypothetical protein IKZ92_02915 [Muribaculaceae bacterium]|nr:hypothetical protein [Muribaculaceae bacterium]